MSGNPIGSPTYFNANERILILIDGQSLHATLKGLAMGIDFKRLLALFRSRGRFVRAQYYTTVVVQEEQPVRPLIDWLEYNGFSLVTKAVREVYDAQGNRHVRGDVRVELAVDAMELATHVDHIVLFTGHSSFAHLCKVLQRLGKRVTVVSSLQTSPPMLSDELRRQADQWVELMDLEPLIGRHLSHESEAEPQRPAPLADEQNPAQRYRAVADEASTPPAVADPPAQGSPATVARAVVVEKKPRSRVKPKA